jgi:hypothetical protein
MTIEVAWDNEQKSIIRWTFPKQWTWDEFYSALQASRAMVRLQSHVVDVIVDMTVSKLFPRNLMTQGQVTMQTTSLNIGIIVVVGWNPLLRTAFNSFQKIYRTSFSPSAREMHIVNMESKAYQLIEEAKAKRTTTLLS